MACVITTAEDGDRAGPALAAPFDGGVREGYVSALAPNPPG